MLDFSSAREKRGVEFQADVRRNFIREKDQRNQKDTSFLHKGVNGESPADKVSPTEKRKEGNL